MVSSPDRLQGRAEDNKKIFDRLVRELVAVVVNRIIDESNNLSITEEQRVEAENGRVEAEEGRVSAEESRVGAEIDRENKEISRDNAEKSREEAETKRKASEEERVSAELARKEAEEERNSKELARKAAEENRETNENARVLEEIARDEQETARAAAESSREAAEAERRENEIARQQGESDREAAEQQRMDRDTGIVALAFLEAERSAESARKAEEEAGNAENAASNAANEVMVQVETLVVQTAEDAAKAAADGKLKDLENRMEEKGDSLIYDEEEQLLYLTSKGEKIGEGVTVSVSGGGSGGGGTGAIMKLVNTMGTTSVPVAVGQPCTITYRFSSIDNEDKTPTGNGSASFQLNGEQIATASIEQGDHRYTIPASSLKEGSNTFVISVTDTYGTVKSISWTITAKAISLTCTLDDTVINTGDLLIRYTPIGSDVTKTTTFEMDGEVVATAETNDTNLAKSYTLAAQAHGAHTLRMWCSATIGGVTVQSPVLTYHLIWVEDGNETPVISIKSIGSVKQYSTVAVRYMVYHPLTLQAAVTLKEDGVEVSALTVDRSLQTWLYKPMETGNHALSITCGATVATVTVNAESSGVTVSEITDGLMWCFDPAGRSNAEADRAVWSDGDVSMEVSDGFHWSHGGWGADEDGYPCFTVPAGDTITISAKPFTTDWKRNGHLFKLVFKAVNVRDYDAQVLSCMSGGIGMTVQAQGAILQSEQTKVTLPLCEDKYTELEFNITPTTHHREMLAWVQGVPSAVEIYAENDSFIQPETVPIVIGSPDCDVRIYRMREYSAYLTDEEMFSNWIADSPSGEEMLARWQRNQITDDYGNIDPDKLAETCPDLRVITLTCPRFTTGKKDAVQGCTVRHVLKSGGQAQCWTATGVKHKGQGTSSEGYGDSARNIDLDFSVGGFDLDDGTHVDQYAMTEESIGVNYLNLKVNVASSENLNNAFLTKEYQQFNPYLRPARQADSRVRDTMEFHPCVLFVQDLSGELFGDTKTHLYAAGDLGNSKKNYEAQGLDSTNENECIVELLNNTSDICRWKSDDLSGELWDGDGALEFRFPENPTTAMKTAFQRVLSWVVSTDPAQATNAALPLSVTYGSTEYKVDSAEYRKAKFVNEFDDYFISDSVMFFYLFTDRHSMVDNRAKNTFWHTEDGLHWDLCFDYDNDTAMGNDNEGGLTLTYGLEDTDTIGTKSVFNAADSVLFCNVRDFLWDRLVTMFQQMETAGAWNSSRILSEAEAYQAAKPERLWVADMRRKYLRPYEDSGITSYLPMMHGTKVLQREQFETYQEPYCASKYMSSGCTSDIITLRGYTPTDYGDGVAPSGNLLITMYSDAYIVVKFGSNTVRVRAKRGEETLIKCPIPKMNDTEIYLCTASRIKKIGSLAALYVGYCNFGAAVRLQALTVSPYDAKYSNTNMTSIDLGNCKLMRTMEICGCPNLAVPLSFDGCPSLETVDLRGTGVTGVTFATGGYLVSALLPGSIASITAKQMDSLETMSLVSYASLRTLHMEYCSKADSLAIVTNATGLTRVRLLGVDWTTENADALVRLTSAGGIDDSGFDTETAIVTGIAHIGGLSQSKLDALTAAFPDLGIAYDTITAEHTVRFLDEDGVTVLDTQIIEHGYGAENPVTRKVNPIPAPTKASTEYYVYTWAGWMGSYTTIIQDTDVTAKFTESIRTYNVKWMNGLDVVQERTIDAGGSAVYEGADLEKVGYIWTGWDKLVKDVLSDLTVNATFETTELPATKLDTTKYDFVYSDDPADNAAYTFGQFVGIISSGLAGEYFNMYDKVKIVNVGTEIKDESLVLSLHSTKHFELADDSGEFAKSTWFMEGVLTNGRQMHSANTNVGGYFGKDLDVWLENTLFPSLACHWRSVIKPVYVLANAGDQSTAINKQSRRLYLPCWAELGVETSSVPYKNEVDSNADELQFSKYTGNYQRIKKTYNGEGSAQNYWTRSAYAGSSSSCCYIDAYGGSYGYYASFSYSVCVGLSI